MSEVKVYCRFSEAELSGGIICDSVKRLKAQYVMDFEGLKICVRKSEAENEYVVFDAGTGIALCSDESEEEAVKKSVLKLEYFSKKTIDGIKKQHAFYGIPTMRNGNSIIVFNTLLSNKRYVKIYERRTGEKFRY
ncbi:hypothetical protein HB999_07570 [Listeria booriae]|uniref:hypothetical protein n=1 Tax=Listeria booriae TaxID=1552123 RepID=UPI00164EBDEA|nr:hypothetical protein [Listeria booriae]MBC6163325.1 hypothetical protein [Listeria booriae]